MYAGIEPDYFTVLFTLVKLNSGLNAKYFNPVSRLTVNGMTL